MGVSDFVMPVPLLPFLLAGNRKVQDKFNLLIKQMPYINADHTLLLLGDFGGKYKGISERKATVYLPLSKLNSWLLKALKEHDVISSYSEESTRFRVNSKK